MSGTTSNSSKLSFAIQRSTFIEDQRQKLRRARPYIYAVIVALLLVVFLCAFLARRYENIRARNELADRSFTLSAIIEKRLHSYSDLLLAFRGLFAASEAVEPDEFYSFFNSMQIKDNFPGIASVSFVKRVRASELADFVAHGHKNVVSNSGSDHTFRVKTKRKRDEHFIVTYTVEDEGALGTDVREDPVREAVYQQALSTGRIILSDATYALSDKPDYANNTVNYKNAYVMVAPIYQNDHPTDSVKQRRQSLIGFISVSFRIEDLLHDILETYAKPYGVSIRFYGTRSDPKKYWTFPTEPLKHDYDRVFSDQTIAFANTKWLLRFLYTGESLQHAAFGGNTLIALVIGLAFTWATALLLLQSQRAHLKLLDRVEASSEELRRSNQIMTEVLDHVPIPLFIKEAANLTVQFWNNEMERLTEVKRSTILQKTGYEIFRADEMERYLEIDRKVLKSGELIATEESITTPSGTRKILLTKKVPIFESSSSPSFLLGISENITERWKLEAENALTEKLKAVGELASGIAHEMNTPLQYISMNLQYLKDKLLLNHGTNGEGAHNKRDTELISAIEQSLEGTERVIHIISALRNSSPSGTPRTSEVDLNKLLSDSILMCTNSWRHVCNVRTEFDPEVGYIECIPAEIGQVIIILVINAADSIEEAKRGDKGEIIISTKRVGDHIAIKVKDNGLGIPTSILNRIYDPFFTTKAVGKGTGQGLAIARSIIVDHHGGKILCDSQIENGATFTIILPTSNTREHAHEMHVCR